MMKKIIGFTAIFILIASLSHAEELRKLNLDDISSVSPRIQADDTVKVEGKSSLKITTQWPTTVYLGEITDLEVENTKLVYTASLKTELDGNAFLEMWAHVDGGQYFSRGMNDAVGQKTEWKKIQTPFMFQKGQKPEKITLNLVINGIGTVWIDDIVLSTEPLE
jgi:hypothetical protein